MFKLIGLIISFGTISVFILSQGGFTALFDPSAALIMTGVFIGGAIFGYGNNIISFIKLSKAPKIKALELFITLDFYNYLSKLTYYSAMIALLCSAVIYLSNNQSLDYFAQAMSLSLLTCLYGVIISTIIIQPIKHGVLYKNMNESKSALSQKN